MLQIIETRRTSEDTYEYININIELDGLMIGTCEIMADDDSAYCERIDIDEKYRNHGYGTEALEMLSDEFGGIVVAPDNEDAQRLYDRLGRDISNDETYAYADQGYGVYRI